MADCDCAMYIVRNGLTEYLRDSIASIFAFTALNGIERDDAVLIVSTVVGECILQLRIPDAVEAIGLSRNEELAVGFTLHMVREIDRAGYSPDALLASMKEMKIQ